MIAGNVRSRPDQINSKTRRPTQTVAMASRSRSASRKGNRLPHRRVAELSLQATKDRADTANRHKPPTWEQTPQAECPRWVDGRTSEQILDWSQLDIPRGWKRAPFSCRLCHKRLHRPRGERFFPFNGRSAGEGLEHYWQSHGDTTTVNGHTGELEGQLKSGQDLPPPPKEKKKNRQNKIRQREQEQVGHACLPSR